MPRPVNQNTICVPLVSTCLMTVKDHFFSYFVNVKGEWERTELKSCSHPQSIHTYFPIFTMTRRTCIGESLKLVCESLLISMVGIKCSFRNSVILTLEQNLHKDAILESQTELPIQIIQLDERKMGCKLASFFIQITIEPYCCISSFPT